MHMTGDLGRPVEDDDGLRHRPCDHRGAVEGHRRVNALPFGDDQPSFEHDLVALVETLVLLSADAGAARRTPRTNDAAIPKPSCAVLQRTAPPPTMSKG